MSHPSSFESSGTIISDSSDSIESSGRRDFLFLATGAVAATGVSLAVWPFIDQMNPDSAVVAAGVPVEVDISPIAVGQIIKLFWRGQLIFIRHRSEKEIREAEDVPLTALSDPQPDSERVKSGHAPWLVVYGSCTHLGCVPLPNQGEYGGWLCPCHGSQFDTSGRVRRGPAPTNLPIPPYTFVSDTKIRIG